MPAITAGKVLVSGANGFVAVVSVFVHLGRIGFHFAQWVVRSLLENGFSVRGAVRSAEKGAHLRQQFSKYGDRFGLAIVPDITKVRQQCASPSRAILLNDTNGKARSTTR
jgi:nucleoside-diphosphate-sugar epimerase